MYKRLSLARKLDKRIRSGHPWVYSNEIDTKKTPLKDFDAGELVEVFAGEDTYIGSGYINPHTLISARIVSRDRKRPFNAELIAERLKYALTLREQFYEKPFYRLVFGDADGLPGLVVDRFSQHLVLQISTAGMQKFQSNIVDSLVDLISPESIIAKNDSSLRKHEGLDSVVECVYGEAPEQLEVHEGEAKFILDAQHGQKTGWFYDQKENRSRILPYIKEAQVLDLFSYVGAWSVRCAMSGAESVTCVDSSESALEYVGLNAERNNVVDKISALKGDVFDALKQLRNDARKFDVVIVDPPAFIKRKKDFKKGETAYRRLNQEAIRLLKPGGILMSCSCSYHMGRETLVNVVNSAAHSLSRQTQILEQGYQGPDHPMHPLLPETAYLKSIIFRIS